MPDNPLSSSGWTNIDDDAPPVRVSASVPPVQPASPEIHQKRPEASIAPNPGAMRLSAFTGIAVVLVLGTLYLGIDNLRGSLSDGSAGETTITITEDKHFAPTEVTMIAGGTLTFENKNKEPQVIKVKEGKELFPAQVLFEKPYSFVIPTDVTGVFTYISETLPDSESVRITVTPAIEAGAVKEPSSAPAAGLPPIEDMNNFPLPFGSPVQAEPQTAKESPTIETSVDVSAEKAPVQEEKPAAPARDNTPEDISVGSGPSSEPAIFDGGAIPTNPFTVGTAKDRMKGNTGIASAAKNLHKGAPLLAIRNRPKANTSTGNELWLSLLPALALMTLAYRRMVAA